MEDGKTEAAPLTNQLDTVVRGLLDPAVLLELIRHFIVSDLIQVGLLRFLVGPTGLYEKFAKRSA